MALYVDSAYLDDITAVVQTVPLAGVTTNPSILLNARERGQSLPVATVLERLLSIVPGLIFMQPSVIDEEQALQEALTYIRIAPDRVLPKIPMNHVGIRVAQRIREEHGYRVAFTAITTVAQAYNAAQVGADFIIPYYNRMRRSGVDVNTRISQMAKVLHSQPYPTRIMVASLKSEGEASEALLAGAHDLTVPPTLLMELITDPATDEAIQRFEEDVERLHNG